jgi:hypothetical protein
VRDLASRRAKRPRTRARAAAISAATCAALTLCSAARAEQGPPPSPDDGEAPPAAPTVARPWLAMSIGMGVTADSTGFDHCCKSIPAFVAMGDIGDGRLGFEAAAFASQATGRLYGDPVNMPVDRLSLDALLVARPLARDRLEQAYGWRVARTIAVELGPGVERDGRGPMGGSRAGVHLGMHLEIPLGATPRPDELRLRLGVRRFLGIYTPQLGMTSVDDTLIDVYAALAFWL